MSEEEIIKLLEELNIICIDYNGYEYGIPLFGGTKRLLIYTVKKFIDKETK